MRCGSEYCGGLSSEACDPYDISALLNQAFNAYAYQGARLRKRLLVVDVLRQDCERT
jgi:hypothetical protein